MPSLSIHSFPGGPSKQNIGHIEGGSGLAAIVKGILMLEKGIIPPVAPFEKLNLNIDADFYNLQVQLPYSQPTEAFASYVIRFQPNPFLGQRMACEGFPSTHLVWEERTHTSLMTPLITFKSMACLASTTATRPQVTLTGLLPTSLPLTDMLSMEPLPTRPRMNNQPLGFSSGLPLTLGLLTACCRLTRAIIRHIPPTITASSISWRICRSKRHRWKTVAPPNSRLRPPSGLRRRRRQKEPNMPEWDWISCSTPFLSRAFEHRIGYLPALVLNGPS